MTSSGKLDSAAVINLNNCGNVWVLKNEQRYKGSETDECHQKKSYVFLDLTKVGASTRRSRIGLQYILVSTGTYRN